MPQWKGTGKGQRYYIKLVGIGNGGVKQLSGLLGNCWSWSRYPEADRRGTNFVPN